MVGCEVRRCHKTVFPPRTIKWCSRVNLRTITNFLSETSQQYCAATLLAKGEIIFTNFLSRCKSNVFKMMVQSKMQLFNF